MVMNCKVNITIASCVIINNEKVWRRCEKTSWWHDFLVERGSTHLMSCRVRLIPCCFPGGVLWKGGEGGYTLNSRRESVSIESWNILPPTIFLSGSTRHYSPVVYPLRGLQLLLRRNIIRLFDIEKRKKFQKSFSENDVSFLVCWASLLSRHLGPEWRHRFNNPRRAEQPANYSREIEEEEEARRRKTMSRRTTVGEGGSFTAVWIFLQEIVHEYYNVKIYRVLPEKRLLQ